MRKWFLGGLSLVMVAALILAAYLWFNRTATFSYANYKRILPGMPLAEVDRLLGGPGVEVDESRLPGIVDWDVPVDHPKRIKPVVTGHRYFRWEQGSSYILVSLRN